MNLKKWFEEIRSTEDGRSMTEMLGVLAIIGVLSIGGISGYKYAIDAHHGNEIMNNLNLMAVSFESQLISDPLLDSFTNEFDLGIEGVTVDAYPSDDMGDILAVGQEAEFFTIELGGMTADVCRQILRNMGQRDDIYILVGNEEFDGENLDVCDNLNVVALWNNPFIKNANAAVGSNVCNFKSENAPSELSGYSISVDPDSACKAIASNSNCTYECYTQDDNCSVFASWTLLSGSQNSCPGLGQAVVTTYETTVPITTTTQVTTTTAGQNLTTTTAGQDQTTTALITTTTAGQDQTTTALITTTTAGQDQTTTALITTTTAGQDQTATALITTTAAGQNQTTTVYETTTVDQGQVTSTADQQQYTSAAQPATTVAGGDGNGASSGNVVMKIIYAVMGTELEPEE